MPTPRTGETLQGATGAQVLDEGLSPDCAGNRGGCYSIPYQWVCTYTLEIAEIVGARRAYLKAGSPSCDKYGITGEVLHRAGIKVIKVP